MNTVTPTVSAQSSAGNLTLSAAQNGLVITTEWTGLPTIPPNLPDGFSCTIINYSNATFTSNAISRPMFLVAGQTYAKATATFSLLAGQSCVLTAAAIIAPAAGALYYFVAKSSA